jgi:hypothetical protein
VPGRVPSVSSVLVPRSGVSRRNPFFYSIGLPACRCFCSCRRFSSSDLSRLSQSFPSFFFPVAFGFGPWPLCESPQRAEHHPRSSAREQEVPLVLVQYPLAFSVGRPRFSIWLRSSCAPDLVFRPTPALAFLRPLESRAAIFFSLLLLTLLSPGAPSC